MPELGHQILAHRAGLACTRIMSFPTFLPCFKRAASDKTVVQVPGNRAAGVVVGVSCGIKACFWVHRGCFYWVREALPE